jgi:hypothetical protein
MSIVWKISQLMPKKYDLEEVSRNIAHLIISTCTNLLEIVSIRHDIEILVKVLVLNSVQWLISIFK